MLLQPSVQAAATIQKFERSQCELNALVEELANQAGRVNEGDFSGAEAMLIVQAHTLDEIFNNLARRSNCQEYMDHLDRFMRLALKAQSHGRATLETLVVIKNPPNVAFVKQANIAHNQQVNNAQVIPSRARENEKRQNELLWRNYPSERLDTGTAGAAVGTDPQPETVGAIDRAANR